MIPYETDVTVHQPDGQPVFLKVKVHSLGAPGRFDPYDGGTPPESAEIELLEGGELDIDDGHAAVPLSREALDRLQNDPDFMFRVIDVVADRAEE